jgi:hypothetical protein
LEDIAASIFRVVARFSEMLVSYNNIMWHHNLNNLDLNLQYHETLKSWVFLTDFKDCRQHAGLSNCPCIDDFE